MRTVFELNLFALFLILFVSHRIFVFINSLTCILCTTINFLVFCIELLGEMFLFYVYVFI